jgi:dethiobiotin synthetase
LSQAIFITGIGTDIGKTVVSAIVTEALQGAYWKPVQAGYEPGTDTQWVQEVLSNPNAIIYPELYRFKLPASPHIAAREENTRINLHDIKERYDEITAELSRLPTPDPPVRQAGSRLIIEGAGGLLVPLNEKELVADLIHLLQAKVILVSRNYLGSINHSLLTAEVCKQYKLDVAGWIFNDQFMDYEEEIVQWSGFPAIGAVPFEEKPGKTFILNQASLLKDALKKLL